MSQAYQILLCVSLQKCEIGIVGDSMLQIKKWKPTARKPEFMQRSGVESYLRRAWLESQGALHGACGLPISVPATATRVSAECWAVDKELLFT